MSSTISSPVAAVHLVDPPARQIGEVARFPAAPATRSRSAHLAAEAADPSCPPPTTQRIAGSRTAARRRSHPRNQPAGRISTAAATRQRGGVVPAGACLRQLSHHLWSVRARLQSRSEQSAIGGITKPWNCSLRRVEIEPQRLGFRFTPGSAIATRQTLSTTLNLISESLPWFKNDIQSGDAANIVPGRCVPDIVGSAGGWALIQWHASAAYRNHRALPASNRDSLSDSIIIEFTDGH